MLKKVIALLGCAWMLGASANARASETLVGTWQCTGHYAMIGTSSTFEVVDFITYELDGDYVSISRLRGQDLDVPSFVYLVKLQGKWQMSNDLLTQRHHFDELEVWGLDYLTDSPLNEAQRETLKDMIRRSFGISEQFPKVIVWQTPDQFIINQHESEKQYFKKNPPINQQVGDVICERLYHFQSHNNS